MYVHNNINENIKVIGNNVPEYLVSVSNERNSNKSNNSNSYNPNKYFNTKNKKYVNFPDIGAFEVVYNGILLFSKKKCNAWPEF